MVKERTVKTKARGETIMTELLARGRVLMVGGRAGERKKKGERNSSTPTIVTALPLTTYPLPPTPASATKIRKKNPESIEAEDGGE